MRDAGFVLDRLVRAVESDGFGAHAVHVLVGDSVAEHRWSEDERRDIHSVAKGVCVLAAGIAADEGLIDLDRPVTEYLPGVRTGAGVGSVTLRHLLSMTSGIDLPWSPTMTTDWPDLAVEYLGRPSAGRAFQYTNASTYTAMRALGAVVGDVNDWLVPRLFAPLGIDAPVWRRCPNGWILGGEGLMLRTEELARIGRLIRDDGEWAGRRVVSERWTTAMHSDWVEAWTQEPGYARYALAGWEGPGPAWRLHGAHGQLVVLLGRAVVTVTADDHPGDRMAERVVEVLEALETLETSGE